MQETSKLGAFTVLKRLGEGPHGTSYQVRQGRQKNPKLLKLLNRGEDDPAELPAGRVAQLQAEVERFAIDHPNLVPLSSGVLKEDDADRLYLLSDFIDGPDLYRFTARAAWTTILEVIVSILRGLETLHGAGVLHGHIAASNVIVFGQGPRKSARLLDPGLGRHVAETRLMGSQLSWAPEVLLGEAPDRRSDLYDLGVLLFECATRSPLFASDDEEELREAHLHEAPRHAREIKRSVPLAVDGLIDALLQKDPAARPPSANALIRELNRKANKRFTTENRGIYLARPLRPRFVARDAALEAIESPTLGAVEGVVPAVLVLTGDAGSGRTRLLAEARRRLCQGEAPPTWIQPTEPTAPALLRALAEVEWSGEGPDPFVLERPYLQRIAPGLGASDRVVAPLEPTSERQRVLEALGQLVRGRAATPLILVVDDLHLADPLLIDMIRLLARDLWDARSTPETETDDDQPPPLVEPPRDANLRVITTLAPDEVYGRPAEGPLKALLGERGVVRHDVAPLAPAELEGILATALGRDAQEVRDLTSRLASATPDPLRALHLLGELATLDALPPPDGAWTVDDERVEQVLSSTGLSAILERRLSAEGTDAARALAQLLAIHGGPLPLDLAARALDVSEAEVVGQALVLERVDLVRVDPVTGPIALRSFAVTDALQAEPSPALHGALGRAAADLAVEDPDGPWVTIAAAHLLRAEAPRGGVPFALVAARQLLESCQPTQAVELLEPALRALDDPTADGELELAQPEPVRRSAGSDLRVACQATLAEAQLQLDRAGAARASAQKAFSAARSSRDARGMIQSLLLIARASLALDDTVQAKTSCEEAAQLAQGGSWKKGLALALHQRGKAEARAGDRDEALSSFEEARGIYAARNDERELAEVLRDMARLRNRRGDPTGAEQALQQALDLDEDGDRGAALARTQLRHADLLRDQGKLDEALSIARRATRQASDVLDLVGAAGGLTSLAETLRIRGELSAARRHEEAALSLWERIGDSGRQAEARLRLGRIQLELGLLDTAEANLNAAAATFKQLRDRLRGARVTAALGDAYLLRGDLSRAGDSLDRALAEAKELGETHIVHQAQCSRARLSFIQGDLAAAEETATAVAEEAARHNHDQSEIAARVVLGLTRLRRGRPQEAERELRDAFELARDRGEGALAARARLAIAQVHLIRGEPAGALAELGQARNIAQRLENAQLEVESLMALGQLHLFLGQVKRAVTLLEMGGEHIGSLGLSLSRPEANVLLAQAVIDQAALSGETPDPALLLRAEGLLDQTEQDTLSATRRRLRTALDITRARLLLLRNDPTSARERAEAALEASKLTGDALHGVAAELLIADARDHQGRHEEALASAERAVSAAEAIRDGEARAAALLKRGRARQKLGQTFLAAQDIREAASHIRGIWASLSEDLREDYQNKPLVREIIEAAGQISQLAEDGAPEEPLPSMPLPSAPLPPEVAKVPLAEVPPTTDPNAGNDSLESLRDPLTNLYNHTFFTAQLETEIKRGNRHSRPLALLKINIDRFKLVRELYGPKTAKKIIRDVAGLLMRNVRDVDIVARYFGDEFEVLLPDTDQHGALLTAKRIGDAVEEHRFEHDDEKIELTLTIGVALFPRDAKDRDALICRVDEALYNARSRGSGSVFSFGADDDKAPVESSPELRELDQLMLTREGRTILSMVSRLVNQELNIDRVIELVTGMVVEATRGERGFILLQGHEGGFSFRHGRNIDDKVINSPELKISNSIAKDVSITGEAVMVSEAIEDGRFRDFKSVMDLGLRSILCAPIKVGDNILGVIYVDHNQVARNFNQEDLNFLIAIADKVAIPINNSKKLRETEDRLELAEARLASQAAQLQTKYKYESIIGRSEAMQKVFKLLDRIVETNHSVVIHGESGTGKELIARAIHFNGPRKTKPFVAENCAALSDTLLEAELFGHVKGAFTGADRDSKGLFELANGGTLFLDEIGDMSERMQKKLLRVLQEGEVRPVGGKRVFNVDVRIVSASNKDLKKLVQERQFREDLYYRLNVITVNLPGLRDRRDDIVLLAEHFIKKHSQSGHDREVDRETLRLLMNYDWPGNVRELENEINRLVAMSDDHVTPDLLSPKIREGSKPAAKSGSDSLSNYYNRSLKEVEHEFMREIILHTLEDTNWHRTKAAKILKVPTSTLFNKMKKYGIG